MTGEGRQGLVSQGVVNQNAVFFAAARAWGEAFRPGAASGSPDPAARKGRRGILVNKPWPHESHRIRS